MENIRTLLKASLVHLTSISRLRGLAMNVAIVEKVYRHPGIVAILELFFFTPADAYLTEKVPFTYSLSA